MLLCETSGDKHVGDQTEHCALPVNNDEVEVFHVIPFLSPPSALN